MTGYEMFKLFLAAAVFCGLLYWIVVKPQRAQRARRKALSAPLRTAQNWDPRIWAGRRNR